MADYTNVPPRNAKPFSVSDEACLARIEMRELNSSMMLRQSLDASLRDLVEHRDSAFVPGRGSLRPRVVFVAERPSAHDARVRLPLQGASGRVFDDLLADIGLSREEVYVTYLVKWYPPRGRELTEHERQMGAAGLRLEFDILLRPPVVLLGRNMSSFMFPEMDYLGGMLGHWHQSSFFGALVPVLSVRHPAYGVYQERNIPKMKTQYRQILNRRG